VGVGLVAILAVARFGVLPILRGVKALQYEIYVTPVEQILDKMGDGNGTTTYEEWQPFYDHYEITPTTSITASMLYDYRKLHEEPSP